MREDFKRKCCYFIDSVTELHIEYNTICLTYKGKTFLAFCRDNNIFKPLKAHAVQRKQEEEFSTYFNEPTIATT